MANKPTSQFTAIATLDSADRIVAYEASASELRTVTGTVILTWIGASLDMSTIASGGALPVASGGTGRATGTTAYALIATGTTATGAQQSLAAGATTEILVGGGESALPVWTTATGSGAPVRATSPTLTTPNLGVATATSLACPTFTSSGGFSFTPTTTSPFQITSGVTTQTTTSSAFSVAVNSLTTGTGLYAASSSLTSGKIANLVVTGTAGETNQTGLNIDLSGAHAGSSVTSYGQRISNTHTGTSSVNVGLEIAASGGSTNYGLIISSGKVGFGSTSPTATLDVKGSDNEEFRVIDDRTIAADRGGRVLLGGRYTGTTTTEWADIQAKKDSSVDGQYGGGLSFGTRTHGAEVAERLRIDSTGNAGFGTTTPTAVIHIKAGTETASTAPLKLTSGTVLTTPEAGVVEYNNTFHMTNSDATRRHVVLAASATKTTAGAPYTNDGYITVNIGGTDVKVMTTA